MVRLEFDDFVIIPMHCLSFYTALMANFLMEGMGEEKHVKISSQIIPLGLGNSLIRNHNLQH